MFVCVEAFSLLKTNICFGKENKKGCFTIMKRVLTPPDYFKIIKLLSLKKSERHESLLTTLEASCTF